MFDVCLIVELAVRTIEEMISSADFEQWRLVSQMISSEVIPVGRIVELMESHPEFRAWHLSQSVAANPTTES